MVNRNAQEQINFQVPYDLDVSGTASIVVTHNNVSLPAVQADVYAVQPGLFSADGVHAIAQHLPDYSLVSADSPAGRGQVVSLFATGLGPVENQPPLGQAAPLQPLSPTLTAPSVTIGGSAAEVLFSGLAPTLAGVYVLNVRVPGGAPSGEADVVVTLADQSGSAARLYIR